ncbi:hypothetical protein QYF36_018255 [Acer negundo]|nr:hypothetical protein QYF36_018255 [Acer negundo]
MNPPLKLLLFMAATVAMLTFTDRASSAITRCPNCGSTPVPYPLSTSPTCGDQSYKIRCDSTNGTLQFDTRNNSYPIMSINPSIQQLVIKPSPLLPNTCVSSDLVHEGVQLDQSLPFNITSSNTIMFMNCTSFMLGTPLNCSSSSLCHVYINSTRGVAPCGDASSSICCSFKAGGTTTWYMIRVREGGCRAYTSFVNLDSNLAVDRWPDPGMEIKWKLPREPRCVSQADCDGNSTCGSDPIVGGSARRCFCMSGFEWDPIQGVCAEITCQNPGGCGGSTDRTALIAGLVAGIGVAIIAATIAILLYRRHKRIKEAQDRLTKEREDILNAGGGGKASKIFTGKEIKKATNNFSNDRLLGTGGYGEVYKGILTDGTIVAVKCAKLGNTKGTDQVLNEVRILCQVNHRSLVGLLGCCVELQQPIMVYEYISNGTLLEHLQGRKLGGRGHLTWRRRLQIAHDTAEGLAYLHSSAVPPIYHRDVKSSNILLDDKLTAKKAIDFNRAADDVNLAIYVQRMMDEEKLMDTIDPMLRENVSNFEVDTMKALAFLAAGCLEDCRQNRPSMKEVTEEIEYIIRIAAAETVKK